MRVPARMDSKSLWLWVLAIVGAAVLTYLELRLDPPASAAEPEPAGREGAVVDFELVE
jgi:hypothetical protein